MRWGLKLIGWVLEEHIIAVIILRHNIEDTGPLKTQAHCRHDKNPMIVNNVCVIKWRWIPL